MKISFIMQAYLGDYPGSRSNPKFKFLRAVQSFIDQTHEDSELIIVSDGCQITHKLYFEHYKSNDRVKYVFVDKDTPKMYDLDLKNKKYYRGFPRQIGLEMATGGVIAYIDSDDFIVKEAAEFLNEMWKQPGDFNAILTNTWYINSIAKQMKGGDGIKFKEEDIVINNLPERVKWCVCLPVKEYSVLKSTSSLSHLRNISVKWKDVIVEEGESSSEDNAFVGEIIKDRNFIINNNNPYYVVCHQLGAWDV